MPKDRYIDDYLLVCVHRLQPRGLQEIFVAPSGVHVNFRGLSWDGSNVLHGIGGNEVLGGFEAHQGFVIPARNLGPPSVLIWVLELLIWGKICFSKKIDINYYMFFLFFILINPKPQNKMNKKNPLLDICLTFLLKI